MPRAPKKCGSRDCEVRVTGRAYCDEHLAEARAKMDAKRGTPTERGYGPDHQAHRRNLEPHVASGNATCVRCGQPIAPGTPWALDHTDDRAGYLGPAHQRCNARAAGQARTKKNSANQGRQGTPPHPPY